MKRSRSQLAGNDPETFLAGGGKMGALMRAHDWSKTPFGPTASWPQSLRSAVSIMLNSRYPIALYWGPELALLYNDAWSPIPGNKHPWALGQAGRAVWPEIWDTIGPLYARVLSTGEGVWQEDELLPMLRRGYTEECYFNFTFSPVRGEDGAIDGIFNAVVETTDRVIAERRLRTLSRLGERADRALSVEEVCRWMMDILGDNNLDVAFALFYLREDAGARLVAASNVEPGSSIAPEWAPITESADQPWPFAAVDRAMSSQTLPAPSDLALNRPAWPEPITEMILIPVMTGDGSVPTGYLAAGVNPRRRLDAAYTSFFGLAARHIGAGIASAQAYDAERRRAEALAEIDRAKTQFFSNVSHEFRTPLTLMMSPLEEALARPSGALDESARPLLDVAHRNSVRLLKLVNTLLDFTRLESGRVSARFAAVDLAKLTADLASNFRSVTQEAGLALRISAEALPYPVYVDADMWEKVVLNLLSNAFKFTFEGEIEVCVRSAPDGEHAIVEVRDTGVGVPAEEVPRLFERFHRIEGQKGRSFEGSGIGLSLVQELVKLHGGSVEATSALGRGTTFIITLPYGADHLPPEHVLGGEAAPSNPERVQAFVEEALAWLPDRSSASLARDPNASASVALDQDGAAHILLVDDNTDMRHYVTRLLSDTWTVEAVSDGEAALAAIARRRPDIVLTDVMMPGIDGFELLRRIRADQSLRELPVILLSARAGEEARVEGIDAGADDYVTKPFSARELVARVRTNLDLSRARSMSSDSLRRSERRQKFLVALADAIRDETDADGVLGASAELFGRYLDADRCGFSELSVNGESLIVRVDWTNGQSPSARGVYPVSALSPQAVEGLREGAALRIDDTSHENTITAEHAKVYDTLRVGADFAVPIHRDGRWVANLFATKRSPHPWTAEEEALAREVAERTWTAVERARAETELRESEEFSRRILDTSGDCIKVLDRDARVQLMSQGGLRIMEIDDFDDVKGRDWREFWSGEESILAHDAFATALSGTPSRFQGFTPTMKGQPRWWDVVITPMLNRHGGVDRLLAVSRDISHIKRGEQERELLIHELNHRVKNTLASVQSIAAQTLRGAMVERGVREALEARLLSLASAHDVLTQQNWEGADLREIVEKAVAPFKAERFVIEGPQLRVQPKAALALAMALHELSTNALKYGALSSDVGRVEILWLSSGVGQDRVIEVRWTESGGPLVKRPQSKGFGSRLIERGLAAELEGEAHIAFHETGIVCTIKGRMPEIAPGSGVEGARR